MGWMLQLNAGIVLEAANARAGQDYQLLVRIHQPRAPGTPLQALQVSSTHMLQYLGNA